MPTSRPVYCLSERFMAEDKRPLGRSFPGRPGLTCNGWSSFTHKSSKARLLDRCTLDFFLLNCTLNIHVESHLENRLKTKVRNKHIAFFSDKTGIPREQWAWRCVSRLCVFLQCMKVRAEKNYNTAIRPMINVHSWRHPIVCLLA